MAEGLCRELKSSTIDAYSAGTETREIDPHVFEVMKEVGIDISDQYSKTFEDYQNINFDYVFTLCKSAKKNCIYFPSEFLLHVGFSDPSAVDSSNLSGDEINANYRKVRDEISSFIENIEDYLTR